jgi:hypothetical protein
MKKYPFRILVVNQPDGEQLFRVVYQEEPIRLEFGSFRVNCVSAPESTYDTLFLRGDSKGYDHRTFYVFDYSLMNIENLNELIKEHYALPI